MTPEDHQISKTILSALIDPSREAINYLFLAPVDTSIYTDYLTYVSKPMDLQTLSQNIDNEFYQNKEEFYTDVQLIWENAIAFNKGKPTSGFVIDLAKKMKGVFERERKKAERRSITAASSSNTETTSSVGDKKKIKLTLKRNSISGGASNPTDDAEDAQASNKAKVSLGGKKITLKLNKGKQLTEGVASNSAQNTQKSSTYTAPSNGSTTLEDFTKMAPMNHKRQAQCYKVLSSLKRRQAVNVRHFLKPVSDAKLVKDYKARIEFPIDLGTITSKLDKNQYPSLAHFVLDIRRVFSNCFQFNTTIKDTFRPVTIECLNTTEDLLNYFIARSEEPQKVYPSLLYCWEDCIKIIHTLTDVKNLDDEYQTAYYFLQDVKYYCAGEYPEHYLERVQKPMSLGDIVQKLVTGCYDSPHEFVMDCRLVVTNCKAYYCDDTDESVFMASRANRLMDVMEPLLEKLTKFDASSKGTAAKEKAFLRCMTIKKPEKKILKEVMAELRSTKYTDKQAKLTEMATAHFEKPVDLNYFPDYRKYVECPMDLETVDGKIDRDEYMTPEDFEYDMSLIFKNCDKYNGAKNNVHMLTLGKYTSKVFKKLFSTRMKSIERGSSIAKHPALPTSSNRDSVGGKSIGKKRPLSPTQDEKPSKRVSIKLPARASSKSIATGEKSAGKLAGSKKAARTSGKKTNVVSPTKLTIDPNVPLPMHVAISKIRNCYQGRRQGKDLEGWESDCLKFLKQLLKHPWISAERPKYIFHVPVEMIFPEIREAYKAKIKYPMDLTTAEAKLLSGIYQYAEEFVSDIALIFANAIRFNQEGYEMGEPLSCAYYEASTHLLKYARWLSLENLQSYLDDNSNFAIADGCASEWGLTKQNRERARKEMEDIVFNAPIDRTEKGDRYSWTETECEKLLKSLKHTSDYKHMMYFFEMTFPTDYTAYISKPIAWIYCQEKLKDRMYNTIGELVEDLRLIFSNALKYNDRVRASDKVSQAAYDSAIYMSQKLELAIDRMLLFVCDKIGREKIDMITFHREEEAKQRAEEDKLKAQWEKENPSGTMEVTKIRIKRTIRKSSTDFEFPFYDEEDDNEESHADSIRHIKAIYEQQQKARVHMKAVSLSIAMHVFETHKQSADAKDWVRRMTRELQLERKLIEDNLHANNETIEEKPNNSKGAIVSAALSADDREKVKMTLSQVVTKKIKKSGLKSL